MKKKFIILLAAFSIAVPLATFAATSKFIYSVWLPFWQSQNGATDISLNLDSLNEVSPFSYEIKGTSTIKDDLNISNGSWNPWFSSVKELGIKIIPTIAWFDGGGIYNLLSVAKPRQTFETNIATLAKTENFDGIDIDFESMTTSTRPYYSLFIQGLATRLHAQKKVLTCTVVPRTPPTSLYASGTIPTVITYPENYSVLNQYCDEVRIMAYDQGNIDLALDGTKGSVGLYEPVADPDWVSKVVKFAAQVINPKKIVLGIPTYGYEYEVTWMDGVTTYQRVRSFTYLDAMDRVDNLSATPIRNSAGELSFTFTSSTYIAEPDILTSVISSTTEPGALVPLNGGNFGTGNETTTLFYVDYPDAQSAAGEIALAKKLGLKGAAFFKADGMEDPLIWQDMTP